ncbi:MAG: helix-turn-helix domain-containing protein [Planctomycetaceae bacterium]
MRRDGATDKTDRGDGKPTPEWWDRYHAILASKLSGKHKFAMLVIAGFAGDQNQCSASFRTLAEALSIDISSARRAVRELHEAGLIERSRRQHAPSILAVTWSRFGFGSQQAILPTGKTATWQNCSPQQAELPVDTTSLNTKKNTKRDSAPPKQFVAPTVDEVAAYCRERDNSIDPAAFVDHYTANGWTCGRSPMRDWKAAVRTWERNAPKFSGKGRGAGDLFAGLRDFAAGEGGGQ